MCIALAVGVRTVVRRVISPARTPAPTRITPARTPAPAWIGPAPTGTPAPAIIGIIPAIGPTWIAPAPIIIWVAPAIAPSPSASETEADVHGDLAVGVFPGRISIHVAFVHVNRIRVLVTLVGVYVGEDLFMVLLLSGKIILVVIAAGIPDHDHFFLLRRVRSAIDPVI